MDDRQIINVLIEYQYNIGEPAANWPKIDFDKVSYSKNAVDEILILIFSNHDWTPMRAAEEFKTICAQGMTKWVQYPEISEMYRIMYDAANDVTDIINAMLP